MPIVEMPDGQHVDMPDHPTPEQMKAIRELQAKFAAAPPKPPGNPLPGTDLTNTPPTTLASKAQDLNQEAGRVVSKSVRDGLLGLPRLAQAGLKAEGGWLEGKLGLPKGITQIPLPVGVQHALDTPSEEPHTALGKRLAGVGETVVGSVLPGPGGLKQKLLDGLVAGTGAEAAGAVSKDSPVAKLLGALVALGGKGAIGSLVPNKTTIAKGLMADVNPDEMNDAIKRMGEAQKAGIPINLSQAMQQPSNIDSGMSLLANSRHGKATTSMLRAQPAQLNLGVEDQLFNLPGQLQGRQEVANKAQEAATAAVNKVKQDRTDAFEKTLEASKAEVAARNPGNEAAATSVSEDAMHEASGKLAKLAESVPNTGKARFLNALRGKLKTSDGAYITDPQKLNEILKDAASKLKSPNLATQGINAGATKWLGNAITDLREHFGDAFEPIREANAVYKHLTDTVVDPLKNSVVGAVAGKKGALADTEAPHKIFQVLTEGTLPGSPTSRILTLQKALQPHDPEVFQDAGKRWFAEKIETVRKPKDNRTPQGIAQGLVEAFGDPRQASEEWQTTKEILVGMARAQGKPDQAYVKGFDGFMRVVSDASRRPSSISGTSPAALREISNEGVWKHLGHVSVMTPLRQPALYFSRMLESKVLGHVDKWLTTPEGARMLQQLGTQKPGSPAWLRVLNSGLGVNADVQGGKTSR